MPGRHHHCPPRASALGHALCPHLECPRTTCGCWYGHQYRSRAAGEEKWKALFPRPVPAGFLLVLPESGPGATLKGRRKGRDLRSPPGGSSCFPGLGACVSPQLRFLLGGAVQGSWICSPDLGQRQLLSSQLWVTHLLPWLLQPFSHFIRTPCPIRPGRNS